MLNHTLLGYVLYQHKAVVGLANEQLNRTIIVFLLFIQLYTI